MTQALLTELHNLGIKDWDARVLDAEFGGEPEFCEGMDAIASWVFLKAAPSTQPAGEPWKTIWSIMGKEVSSGAIPDDALITATSAYSSNVNTALWDAIGVRSVDIQTDQLNAKGIKSASTKVVDLLLNKLDFFCDPVGVAWVGLPVPPHTEFVPVRSSKFRSWVGRRYYEKYHKTMGGAALEDAITVFIAKAADNPTREVYTRLAHYQGKLYIDLCNQNWEFVEVDPAGWHVITNPPIPFKRSRGMKPLPTPELSINDPYDLRQFTNLDDEGWNLVMGWLLGAFGPGDYPILVLNGEQGSGKSTLSELLRRLIDPNEADLRGAPREEQTLMIAASNSHVLAFDNLSSVPDWLSDSLCRISTGAGFATRELYTNQEEVIISVKRPMLINGITDLVTRGDLLSRSIIVTVPTLDDTQRVSKDDYWIQFEAAQPYIFGLILDTLSHALANFPKTKLTSYPRMADFARWVMAAGPSMGWGPDKFLSTYELAAQNATIAVLDYSMVANELQVLIKQNPNWKGTTMDLLEKLRAQSVFGPSEDYFHKLRPNTLAGELKRLAPILRKVGINLTFHKPAWSNGRVQKLVELSDLNVLSGVRVP